MMKMNKWNKLFISLLLLFNSGYLLYLIMSGNQSRILVTLSLYLTVFIPAVIRHSLKVKITDRMEFFYLLFLFFAQFLGSVVNLYSSIYWFDSFVHFASGILTAVFSLAILFWFHKYDSKTVLFNIFFMIAVSLMAASFWEFFEFTCDRLLGGDAQKAIETGVFDTMKDMIVAFLGSLLTSIYYGYEKGCNKKLFFNGLEKEFGCKYE